MDIFSSRKVRQWSFHSKSVVTVMTNIWIVTVLQAGCLSVLLVQKGLIDVKDQGLSKDNLAISIQFTLVLAVSCKGTPRGIFSDLPSKR